MNLCPIHCRFGPVEFASKGLALDSGQRLKKKKKKNINTGLRQGTNSYSVYDTKMFILFFADLVRVIKQ